MEAHDFANYKVPLFGRKTVKTNISMSAAPTIARVPASRYYCDVTWSDHNVYAKRFEWGPMTKYNKVPLFAPRNR